MPLQKIKKPAAPKPPAAAGGGKVRISGTRFFSRRVTPRALSQFTVQLSTLQGAGVPLARSLKILEGQMRPGPFKEILAAITEDVEGGSALSEAFAKFPSLFDRLYVNMVRAGEAGGILDQILIRLARFSEKTEQIKSRIREALTYPTLVLLFAAGILTFIMLVVIPKFQTIFENFDQELPLPTRMLIGFSESVVGYWFFYAGIPAVLYGVYRWALRFGRFRFIRDQWALRVPFSGDLVKKTVIARFSRTLGTLLQSGVPILDALAIVKGAIANSVLEAAVGDVHGSIREGEGLAVPLGRTGLFDDLVVNMVDVGETTGSLDAMLLKIADAYEEEVDLKVSTLFKAIEPVIIIALALVVGFIVMALFLPMLKMLSSFSNA